MLKKAATALLAGVFLSQCFFGAPMPLGSGIVPDDDFNAMAIDALDAYQAVSFDQEVEVCGYFGFGPDGEFVASEPSKGRYDICIVEVIPNEFEIVASYHTHSTFDTDADSEVPSSDDLRADIDEEVFGYVATPGGRVWLIDWRDATARQLCGIGCVAQDPDFVAGDAGPIANTYTFEEIKERERSR